MIPWNNPKFGTKELELVKEVLESGYVSEGPMTKELEEKLSTIVKAKHIIMTTSATAALYLAIEADKRIRDYTQGEVMIPNLTFIATKNAVEMAGLKPIVKDVRERSYLLNVSVDTIPKIWLSVNLLGRKGCEMTYPSTLICDNAGCLGSNVPNGKVGCYSLQANKLVNCGQGGFCATDDDEYAKVIRQIKDFGREHKDDQHTNGFNFKFNDIQAAVALGQLSRLIEKKVRAVNQYLTYREELYKLGEFIDFDLDNGEIPLWVEFITNKRDELFEYLKSKGIECRKPWKVFIDSGDYPNSVFYQNNIIWLPNGDTLNNEDQDNVIKCIREFYNGIQ